MADPTAEQTLTLENISGRIVVVNLTLGHGATRHVFKRANDRGEQRVVLPPTFTLLSREKREKLDPGLLAAPEIKNAIAAKRVRATLTPPNPVAEPMKASAPESKAASGLVAAGIEVDVDQDQQDEDDAPPSTSSNGA